jgi:hypothetical protein
MQKIDQTVDVARTVIKRGDVVTTVGDNVSAKVADICQEMGTDFLLLKSQHQTYRKGVWHPADQVLRISKARVPVPVKTAES